MPLRLHYLDAITEELYIEEQLRITDELARLQAEDPEPAAADTSEQDFEQLVAAITAVDLDHAFDLATENERRILIDELIESVNIGPEHFSVKLFGSPAARVRYGEVGLKDSHFVGVGGGTRTKDPQPTPSGTERQSPETRGFLDAPKRSLPPFAAPCRISR